MTIDDDPPPDADAPAALSEEAGSLRRMLEYAQLIARDLKLATAERLIGAALLSVNEAGQSPRAEPAPGLLTPDRLH